MVRPSPSYLEHVDLLVGEGALHGPVVDAEALGGLARLGVDELVDQLHLVSNARCREGSAFELGLGGGASGPAFAIAN